MSNLARCLTLAILDGSDVVQYAYQSQWNSTVTIDGQAFAWQPFDAQGVFQGGVSGQSSTSVDLPRTPNIWAMCVAVMASSGLWLAELELWEFAAEGSETGPPALSAMTKIGRLKAQIVKASNIPYHTLKLQLGSSMSAAGSMIPPRKATTWLIGKGIME